MAQKKKWENPFGDFEAATVKTPLFTMAFPKLLEPDENDKLGFTMYFDNADALKPLMEEIERVVDQCFDGREPGHVALREIEDEEHENYEWTAPYLYKANVSTKRPVKALDRYRQRLDVDTTGAPTPEVLDEALYAGARCKAMVKVQPWSNMGKKGISFYLQSILKVSDGPRIGGGASNPMDDYADDFEGDAAKAVKAAKSPTAQPSGPTLGDIQKAFSALSRADRREVLAEFEIDDVVNLPKNEYKEFLAACGDDVPF